MSLLRASIVLVALLVTGTPVFAQSDQAQEPESGEQAESKAPGKQYQVEVITFQYLGPDSSDGERFDRLFVDRYLPSAPFDIDEYSRIREAVSYTQVRHLAGALERLRQSQHYSIMSSSAWIQPLLNRGEAVAVPLGEARTGDSGSLQGGTGQPASARMSGSLSVYGDYLLFVDLELMATLPGRGPSRTESPQNVQSPGSGPQGFSAVPARSDVFRISERRRIKLEEFHYFDHPYMGAIVSVTRHQQNEASAR